MSTLDALLSPPIACTGDLEPEATDRFADEVAPALRPGRVLVSLVGIEGAAPRPLGAQMVVAPPPRDSDGALEAASYWGYLTGGCLERAIVAEACAAARAGTNRLVRFGAGSPYVDLVLPCGSGIDVFFDVALTADTIADLRAALARRQGRIMGTNFAAGETGQLLAPDTDGATGVANGRLLRRHEPPLRLVVAGAGVAAVLLTRLARASNLETVVISPDPATLEALADSGAVLRALQSPRDPGPLHADARTALAVLFHDHDWEPTILAAALTTPAFYIGAMGSRRTHANRLEALARMGVPAGERARITGPAGLGSGARSGPELASAILAQVLQEDQRQRGMAPRISGACD